MARAARRRRPAGDGRRHRDDHLQQRQHGRAQGGGPLPLQHRFERPGDPRGLPRPAGRSAGRHPAAVPLVRLHDLVVRDQLRASGSSATPARSTPPAIGELVQRYAATVLLATPTFLQLYLRRCAPAQFGSLRLVLAGAEKLPETLALAFEDAFGIRPMEGYGMTECSPVVAVNTFDYRAPGFFQPGSRRGYVGRPLPGVAVRIVRPRHLRTARTPTPRASCWSRGRTSCKATSAVTTSPRPPSSTAGTTRATSAS